MPLGIVAIWIGWYGAAHAKYGYDQFPYLISGGLFGVGLCVIGGFVYFGSWIARIAEDQRAVAQQIATALAAISEAAHREQSPSAVTAAGSTAMVLAGRGKKVHRPDCSLVAGRSDTRRVRAGEAGLSPCRVCRPAMGAATAEDAM